MRFLIPLVLAVAAGSSQATTVIKVLIAFTPNAVTALGIQKGGTASAEVFYLGNILADSGLDVQASLAGTVDLAADYSTTDASIAAALNDQILIGARNSSGADLMFVVTNSASDVFCGLASGIFPNAAGALAMVHSDCLPAQSLPHEFGHLLGARHAYSEDSSLTPFAYAHGYKFNGNGNAATVGICFQTIEAQSGDTCGTYRIGVFSNLQSFIDPSEPVYLQAVPEGSNAVFANTASVFVTTAPLVANFHLTTLTTTPGATVPPVTSANVAQLILINAAAAQVSATLDASRVVLLLLAD